MARRSIIVILTIMGYAHARATASGVSAGAMERQWVVTPIDPRLPLGADRRPESLEARGIATDHLYHYTGPDAAITGILMSGSLRLSPYASTNDLWESRPFSPHLSIHEDDEGWLDKVGAGQGLWIEIDQTLRLHTKVACLTADFALPDHVSNRDARRGWAHLALWAHYGGDHTGVCLRFDRTALISAFMELAAPGSLAFHGPVHYVDEEDTLALKGLDVGQIREFGVDAVARIYAENNRESLFFSKNQDWSNEEEYRLVLLNGSALPVHIDIRKALTGIVLGEAFPENRQAALREVLESYPDLEIRQAGYANRRLVCLSKTIEQIGWSSVRGLSRVTPRRSGDLLTRTTALREAEAETARLHAEAENFIVTHATVIEEAIAAIAEELQNHTTGRITVHPVAAAVPPEQRSRKPGVSGELVHIERGAVCNVDYMPGCLRTLWAGAAVQVLDGGVLRMHAVARVERWVPDDGKPHEYWREVRTVPVRESEGELHELLSRMRSAFDEVRVILEPRVNSWKFNN